MSVGTELEKLKQLQKEGVLTEAEFQTAKSKLLNTLGPENTVGSGVNQLGAAAKSWVNLQWVANVSFNLYRLAFFPLPFSTSSRYPRITNDESKDAVVE